MFVRGQSGLLLSRLGWDGIEEIFLCVFLGLLRTLLWNSKINALL